MNDVRINNTKKVNSSRKGGVFERKQARVLGQWMFNDPTMLYRNEDSGARKVVYCGDIIPKNADKFPWSFWPFVCELKNGYKNHIPTLMNFTIVRRWLTKLLSERTDTQKIPILICQFHAQKPILLTNINLNAKTEIQIAIEYLNDYYFFQVYMYNDLIESNFEDIMPDWFFDTVKYTPAKFSQDTLDRMTSSEIVTEESISNKRNSNIIKQKQRHLIGEIIDKILI